MNYLLYTVDSEDNNQPIARVVEPAPEPPRSTSVVIGIKCTELFAAYPDAEWIDVARYARQALGTTNHIATDDDDAFLDRRYRPEFHLFE